MAGLLLGTLLGALPSAASGIYDLIKGNGGASRRRVTARRARRHASTHGGALAVMAKFPLINRPFRYAHGGAASRRRTRRKPAVRHRHGGSLATMAKFPLINRPFRYAHGGALRHRRPRRPLHVTVRRTIRRRGPRHISHLKLGVGGSARHIVARRHGGLNLSQFQSIFGMLPRLAPSLRTAIRNLPGIGTVARAVGVGGRVHARPRGRPSRQPRHAAGSARMYNLPMLREVAHVMGVGGKVRSHVRHTASGPVHVRAHLKGGLLSPAGGKVRSHVRHTASGPVHVRAHVKGGALRPIGGLLCPAGGKVRSHIRHTAYGPIHVRAHAKGGYLVMPQVRRSRVC